MAYRPRNNDQRDSRKNQIQPSEPPSGYNNHGPKTSSPPPKSSQDDVLSKFNVYTGGDKSKDKVNVKSSGLEKYNVYSGESNDDKALSKYNDKQRSKDSSRLDKYNVYSGDTKPKKPQSRDPNKNQGGSDILDRFKVYTGDEAKVSNTKPQSRDPNKNQGGADILDRFKVYTGDEAKVSNPHHRIRPNTYSDAEVIRSSGDDVADWSSARNSGTFEGYYSDRSNHLPPAGELWGMAEDMDNTEGGGDPGAMTDGSNGRFNEDQQHDHHQDDGNMYDDAHYDEYEEDLMNMPSQMFMAGTGSVRYRTVGRQRQRVMWDEEDGASDTQQEEVMKFDDIATELNTLRSQPWSIQKKRKERYRLKKLLAQSQRPMLSMGPVLNIGKSGQSTVSSILDTLNILRPILQKIQSRFGQSVVAVFNLIRDLLVLNFILILLLSTAVIAPTMILINDDEEDQMSGWTSLYTNKTWNDEDLGSGQIDMCVHIDKGINYTNECSSRYMNVTQNATETTTDALGYFANFLGGTGMLERTFLFSGYYPISVNKAEDYSVSLAYLITMGLIYFVSFLYVAYFLAKWVRSTAISTMKQSMVYSTIVFSSWDFSTKEEEASKLASKLITSELKVAMDTETFLKEKTERKTLDKIGLFAIRLLLNLFMLAVIGLGWWAIYEATRFANEQSVTDEVQSFLLEYFPTIVVSGLNFISPFLFTLLVPYEKYSGRVELLITLVRSVLVRLTSLGVLFLSQFAQIIDPINGITEDVINDCIYGGEYLCWETHLGQQVYSLLVLELLIQIGVTFVMNTLRRCIGKRFKNGTLQAIGNIQFYVPGHVLDVVYIQTLCWLGAIYSPLMPALAVVMLLLHFGFKMFTVFVTCLPPDRIFKASRSSAMFMTVLSISYALCLVPTGFAVLWITPSRSCGPFRGLNIAWEVFTYSICIIEGNALDWIRDVIFFLDNGLFIVIVFLVIIFFAVYFSSINAAKGAYVKVLQNRMKTVTHEKRRLMDKYKNLKKRQPVKG